MNASVANSMTADMFLLFRIIFMIIITSNHRSTPSSSVLDLVQGVQEGMGHLRNQALIGDASGQAIDGTAAFLQGAGCRGWTSSTAAATSKTNLSRAASAFAYVMHK